MNNPKALFLEAVALFRADKRRDAEAVALLYRSLYESSGRYRMRPAVAAWLGWAHKNGRGVPQDHHTALMWYRQAERALRHNDPNREWIKERVQRLEAQNLQPQPTPDELRVWGLGRVKIKRSEKYSYRIKEDYAEVTIPHGAIYDMAVAWLWDELQKREESREESNLPEVLDETLQRDYPLFQLRLERGNGTTFSHRKEGTRYTIIAPRSIRFEERISRETIIRQGLNLMKSAAEEYLPRRLKAISERIGLGYSHCHISHGTATLGCFYYWNKRIDLSMHLMKRTPLQIDAVIAHELCHGVQQNHYNEFHYAVEQYGGAEIAHADRHLFDNPVPIDI